MKETIIVSVLIIAILVLAVVYIVKSKKSGRKCIGCPDAKSCPSVKDGHCTCFDKKDTE